MRVIQTKTYEEMSKITVQCLLGHMLNSQHRVNLSITAGSTPVRAYELLVTEVKDKNYFGNVHYYNFDEIPHKKNMGNSGEGLTEGITMTDLRRLYYTPAGIAQSNIHILNENNYENYDKKIASDGGLDMVLLGIGADGHFCGNLPGTTEFKDYTTKVIIDDAIKSRIARFFSDPEDIPDFHITMGPAAIMQARHLILIASGHKKAEIMKIFMKNNVDPKYPASILKLHPNLTVIMDQEAASLL